MSRSVLVSLATEGYLDQVKQLFAGAYAQGGWRGDFLIVTPGISKSAKAWFEERGILIRECAEVFPEAEWASLTNQLMPSIVALKFHLFSDYFRRWRNVLYLDADIIIRRSLSGLESLQGFWALQDFWEYSLRRQLKSPVNASERSLVDELGSQFDFGASAFNSGVFAYSTDLISDTDLDDMRSLFVRYAPVLKYYDQSALNLWWHDRWQRLPLGCNAQLCVFNSKAERALVWRLGDCLHFSTPPGQSDKPWDAGHQFEEEWRRNLDESELLNIEAPRTMARRSWRLGRKSRSWLLDMMRRTALLIHDRVPGPTDRVPTIGCQAQRKRGSSSVAVS